MHDRIARIRHKLEAGGKVLNPPLAPDVVEAFERLHDIHLPEAYRAYLLEIGDGGDGPPEYGVVRLGEASSDVRPEQAANWTALPRIKQAFPFTKPWIWENDEESDEGSMDHLRDGSLSIGNDGCGMYWHLIVTGLERGQVWTFAEVGITTPDRRCDFLQWYEDWLDGVEFWSDELED